MRITSLVAGLALCAVQAAAADKSEKSPLAHKYGFLPPEIYKLDGQTTNLILRDVNADSRMDVVVVNNQANRIDVLLQRPSPDDRSGIPARTEVNEVLSDWRLLHRKIPVAQAITSLEIGDVNSDGRPDLVYLGDPAGLYVEYQEKDGRFLRRRSFEKADAQKHSWAVDIGDVNHDGRNDIVFLGQENLYVVLQGKDSGLEDPLAYRLTDGGVSILKLLDFNDDGRSDAVYISDDAEFPVRLRFQDKSGKLGPERRFKIDRPLGVSYANMDGKPGQELLAVSSLSHRLMVYTLAQAERDPDAPMSQLVVFPFERTGSSSRTDVVAADFDGDKRMDIVVSDSNAPRFWLQRQRALEGLDLGRPFPGMNGVTALRAADADADGKFELFALSPREKSIAVSRFRDNRLEFPQALPTRDEPLIFEVLGTGGGVRLAYVARTRDQKTQSDIFALHVLRQQNNGPTLTWAPVGSTSGKRFDLRGVPNDLRAVDANGDGRLDLLVCFDFDPPELWLDDGKGEFVLAAELSRGVLSGVAGGDVFFGSIRGSEPALVVAQSNFARKVRVGADGNWKVLDQYNATDSSGRVTGIAVLDLDGDQQPELAVYDRNGRSLVFLKLQDGLFVRWKQLKVGAFDLRGMRAADFDHNGKTDLLLFDADKLGIAYADKADLELRQIASYESEIRGGKLFDIAPGDLNGDDQIDILGIEPVKHHLEVVAVLPDNRLQRALVWPVFEEKTFRRPNPSPEPREAVVGDVNHDGLADIVTLVHDRVLIYLQDDGLTAAKSSAAKSR